MPDSNTSQQRLKRLEAALAASPAGPTSIRGPVRVLSSAIVEDGGTMYQVSASTLIPVDADDPALAGVSIPLPVDATIVLDRHGSVTRVSVPPIDPGSIREARAYARTLIDNGAVRGLAPAAAGPAGGPPTRATHELTADARGEKVIRRVGFSGAG